MTRIEPRILMAPMNFADQPMSLIRALRERGVEAHHVQYTATGEHALGYALDRTVRMKTADFAAQLGVLAEVVAEGFNIFHFWQRSLLFGRRLDGLTGLDLPLIKAHGGTIFHRFTGFDLRMPTRDKEVNRFSPFHYGYQAPYGEEEQRAYIDMLREHVDIFFVQDPELHQFIPEARILPRGLQLEEWPVVGVVNNDRPLVVHAPSNAEVKGSRFIVRALEELSTEGVSFDFKLLERVPHSEAREWYRRADIIIDQIMIGATGVLTLEAWALGKPCITYLREDLFEPFYGTHDLPVANANPDSIKSVLRSLISDREWRHELGRRGRELIEAHHDIRKIAEDYEEICRDALEDGGSFNRSVVDIIYFRGGLAPLLAEPDPVCLPEVDYDTRRGLPLPRALDTLKMSVAGRIELRIHNAIARASAYLLAIEERFLERLSLSDRTREWLWIAQVRFARALSGLNQRGFALLVRIKRRLTSTATPAP